MTLRLIASGPLQATADPRVKRGLLLPYGEPGFTNKGKVLAAAGALRLADKPDPLTLEHAPKLGVADFVAFDEAAEGLYCSVRYLDTPLGNAGLAEYENGTRAGLSVEVDQPIIRAGRLVAGIVTGGSQVETPAFASAKLAAAELGDAPDEGDPDTPDVVIDGRELDDVATVTVSVEQITITTKTPPADTPPADQDKEPVMTAAKVQNPALAGVARKGTGVTTGKLFAALAAAQGGGAALTAALADITPPNILGIEQPQYVGELWDGKAYQRRIVPLFNHAVLSSFKVQGWRWGVKPAVGLYEGDKTDIPSNAVTTVATEITAQRIAGGHDIDRKFRDFSNNEFWAAYFAAMTESYAKVSDAYVLTEILGDAPVVTPGATPPGVSAAMAYIVDGALAILTATESMPSFAVVAPDLWRGLVLTRTEDTLAYLNAALGLEDGTIGTFQVRPSTALTAGQVLVGCKEAATVHELGGEAPIRVEALDIARGGIDEGVFGYVAVNLHDADGLALVEA